MNQQSATTRTHRKTSIGGSLAVVVAAVAIAFGTCGVARADDGHGIVAAERYRAPQASTQDLELGDTTVAEQLQNDAFLKAKAAEKRQTVANRQAGDPTAEKILGPRDVVQTNDTTADRMKANPRRNLQADDTTAERMKANPRNNPQADDATADRMKADPRR